MFMRSGLPYIRDLFRLGRGSCRFRGWRPALDVAQVIRQFHPSHPGHLMQWRQTLDQIAHEVGCRGTTITSTGIPNGDLIDLDEKGRALDGVLAMQVHKGPPMTIEFKDMLIKHLPDDLPLLQLKDHPIPADARGARPSGRLPKDWKAPIYGER